jgi:predicted RNase H-like nuclease
MNTFFLGIDVATTHSKVGLALAVYESHYRATLLKVQQCGKDTSPANTITDWIRGQEGRIIMAMDAPLGWPKAMGEELSKHSAGMDLTLKEPNQFFRRETDRFIKSKIGKTPLDVGADRIARTAHAALALLGDVRNRLGKKIPLAWSSNFTDIAAIEVYPAATSKALGIRSYGYKAKDQKNERKEILRGLSGLIEIGEHEPDLMKNPDVLDAVVCVIAGMDFIAGRVMHPEKSALAKREGWIWVRPIKK